MRAGAGPAEGGGGFEPGAVVALLFTDLVGSTQLFDRLGDDLAGELHRAYFEILRDALARSGGREIKSLGDGLMVAFASPVKALGCAVAMQRGIDEHNRREPGVSLRVRVGVHAGEVEQENDDCFGTAVVVARRLCERAEGGQILASELLAGLAGSRGGFGFRSAGALHLKGLIRPVPAVLVDWYDTAERASTPSDPVAPALQIGRHLMGRASELSALETELARAAGGSPRCVALMGEPGVGKTRLASEFLERNGHWVTTLSARAHPHGRTTPFGVWGDALDNQLRNLGTEHVSQLCGTFLEQLAQLCPNVATAHAFVVRREPIRHRLLEGLAVLLANLAQTTPVCVFLDDMHLGDASSWEALECLARGALRGRVLLVVAARPAELTSQPLGAEALLRLERGGLLSRINVKPLDRGALGQLAEDLLEQLPPKSLLDWLLVHSGGNPATAGGLLQGLLDDGADIGAPELQPRPPGPADWIGPRIEILEEKALRTLQVLVFLGRPVELGELLVLADCPSKLLVATLIELVRARLVDEERQGGTYAVADSLVRDAVAGRMGGTDHRKLHRELGRALLASGRIGEGASHLVQAAEVGDADALEALWASLQQAEALEAYGDSAAILQSIVDLLPPGDDGWVALLSAQTWRRLAHCRPGAHQTVGMSILQAAATRLEPREDSAARAAVKLRMASLRAWGSGELAEAESDAREALALFGEAKDRPGALLAAHELAWVRGLMGDLAGSQADARQVLDEAEAAGERRVTTLSLHGIGFTAAFRGRFQEAEAALRGSIGVSRGVGDTRLLASSLAALAVALGLEGRLAEAFPVLEEARSTPTPVSGRPFPVEWEILLHWLAGDAGSAVATSREAIDWAPERLSRRRALGMVFAALSALEGGQPDEADRFLTEASGALGERDWLFARQYVAYGRAQLGIWEGRTAESIRTLQEVASDLLALEARPFAAFVLVDLAEASGATGEAGICHEAAASLEGVAQHLQRNLFRGLAALAGSWSALAAGRPKHAATRARASSTLLAATGCQAYLGRAQQLSAQSLSSSNPVEAVSLLEAALTTFETCGALGRRDWARLVLETLTPPDSAADRIRRTPLTPREREVARLAAAGHSTPEIARRLFLDQRAVDAHIQRACAKLELSSPLDLILRASELGLQ